MLVNVVYGCPLIENSLSDYVLQPLPNILNANISSLYHYFAVYIDLTQFKVVCEGQNWHMNGVLVFWEQNMRWDLGTVADLFI